MKKLIANLFLMLVCIMSMSIFSSCHVAAPDAGQECAIVARPYFFGYEGVRPNAVETGREYRWLSDKVYTFSIIPTRYDEAFDDIYSNDNTPVDFHSYIVIQIEKGKSPVLLQNYGVNWYKNIIQVEYRNKTRELVSMYSPYDLISNREVLNDIDSAIAKHMKKYVADLSVKAEMPIIICRVTTGAAKPNEEQLEEMNSTASTIQATNTQKRIAEMQKQREIAETARGRADNAYKNALGLTNEQFIQLKYIEMVSDKKDANIDVLVGPATNSLWNIRR